MFYLKNKQKRNFLRNGLPRLVEAQATIFHFPLTENFIRALASPLPTKAVRLCGDPFVARNDTTLGYLFLYNVSTSLRHCAAHRAAISYYQQLDKLSFA